MSKFVARTGVFAAIVLLLTACTGPYGFDLHGYGYSFDTAQRRYTQFIRWAEYDRAAKYVAPKARPAFLKEAARLRDVQFTDYDVLSRNVDPVHNVATVTVMYRAYRLSSAAMTVFDERQEWSLNPKTDDWQVHSVLREKHSSPPT